MFELSDTTRTRIDVGMDVAARAVTGVVLITAMHEAVTHSDEICVAGKGAAAIALYEATGNLPSWTPHEYAPITATSGPEAMNALLGGAATASLAAQQQSHCF